MSSYSKRLNSHVDRLIHDQSLDSFKKLHQLLFKRTSKRAARKRTTSRRQEKSSAHSKSSDQHRDQRSHTSSHDNFLHTPEANEHNMTSDSALSLDAMYYERNNMERNRDLISFAVVDRDQERQAQASSSSSSVAVVPNETNEAGKESMESNRLMQPHSNDHRNHGYRTMDTGDRGSSSHQSKTGTQDTNSILKPPEYRGRLTSSQARGLLAILINYSGSTMTNTPSVSRESTAESEEDSEVESPPSTSANQVGDEKKLEPRAIISLEIFCFLTVNDEVFQHEVENESLRSIRKLKLGKHIQQGSDEHKKICSKLVKFLSSHYRRLCNWREFVSEQGHEEMELQISQLEDIADLAKSFFDSNHLPPPGSYHNVSAPVVPAIFKSSVNEGLYQSEIEHRKSVYGSNVLPKMKRRSVIYMFVSQIIDFMVLLLIAAAAMSMIMKDFGAGGVLLAVVVFNVIVGFTQDYKAERALSSLLSITVQRAIVTRDGKTVEIDATDLVPGDIVTLEEGAQIPADIHLVEVHELSTIESLLTGESSPVNKNTNAISKKDISVGDKTNMVFMSTYVARGHGKGVVVATGKQTEIGKISESLVNTESKPTRLQRHLKRLGMLLVAVSVFVCIVVTVIGFIRKFDRLEMVKTGVSLAVSVIPEGLVAVTTFTMALSVQRMAKKHVIVRKMPSVETLGSVTSICCDKTGTVTEGKMEMTHIVADGEMIKVNSSDGTFALDNEATSNRDRTDISVETRPIILDMLRVAALCNNATISETNESKTEFEERYDVTGDPTETSMMVVAFKAGLGKEVWTEERQHQFLEEIAFDSERKIMTAIYSVRDSDHKSDEKNNKPGKSYDVMILTKGAPECVIPLCENIKDKNGTVRALDEKSRSRLLAQNLQMAKKGLRVLAFAERRIDEQTYSSLNIGDCEKKLCFLGLVALFDPPRKAVSKSIRICRRAGIRVFLLTGDHASTGRYVAETLHIIPSQSSSDTRNFVLEGKDVDRLVASNTLSSLDPFPQVFARVSPENKIQLVEALQKRGEVVAMIGDGINDAASIRKADVGVAMGKNSTDVAKEAATIILTDNNFSSIVEAIKEGRHTFDNIKIFVLYLLSCNLGELMIMFLTIATSMPIPFSSIQILWANLIADTPPALSLGIEPIHKYTLRRLPRSPKQGLFTFKGWIVLLYQSVLMTAITLSGFALSYYVEGYSLIHSRSFTFALLISVQLVHAFHSKSITLSLFSMNWLGNKWLVLATLFSFTLVVVGIYTPKVNYMLDFVPLDHWDWVKVIFGCIIHSLMIEASKILIRRYVRAKSKDSGRSFFIDI